MFWFSLPALSVTFIIIRRTERDKIRNDIGFHVTCCTHYSWPILMRLELSRQIWENSSNVKFHENSSGRSWVVSRGRADEQTDRYYEANSRFSQFCVRSKKKKHQSQYLVAKTSRQYAERKIVLASDTHIKHSWPRNNMVVEFIALKIRREGS